MTIAETNSRFQRSTKEQLFALFERFPRSLVKDAKFRWLDTAYLIDLTSDGSGFWYVIVRNGFWIVGEGETVPITDFRCKMVAICMTGKDFLEMCRGKVNPQVAFLNGKLCITGGLAAVLRMQTLFSLIGIETQFEFTPVFEESLLGPAIFDGYPSGLPINRGIEGPRIPLSGFGATTTISNARSPVVAPPPQSNLGSKIGSVARAKDLEVKMRERLIGIATGVRGIAVKVGGPRQSPKREDRDPTTGIAEGVLAAAIIAIVNFVFFAIGLYFTFCDTETSDLRLIWNDPIVRFFEGAFLWFVALKMERPAVAFLGVAFYAVFLVAFWAEAIRLMQVDFQGNLIFLFGGASQICLLAGLIAGFVGSFWSRYYAA